MIVMMLVGSAMIILTTMIHAGFTMAGIGILRARLRDRRL